MKRLLWIVGVLLFLMASVVMYVFWSSTHIIFHPEAVHFTSVSVTKERIEISISSSYSAVGYTGYKIEHDDGALYFTLQGSYQDTPFSRVRSPDISIPNTYGDITAIYVRGGGPSMDVLVWKDGDIVDRFNGSPQTPMEVPVQSVTLNDVPQEITPDMVIMGMITRPDGPYQLISINLDKTSELGVPKTNVVRITDTANLYSVEIPRDWNVTLRGSEYIDQGRMLHSWVGGQSRDWVLETLGYDGSLTHVRSGAAIEITANSYDNNSTPSQFVNMGSKYLASGDIILNGITGKLHIDQEYDPPYHEEVLAIEALLDYRGNYYTFRITYNPTTYPQGVEVFLRMLKSIRFTQ